MTLTTEQVIAELHKARDEYERTLPGGSGAPRLIELNGRMRELIDQLPRADIGYELTVAFNKAPGHLPAALLAVVRRYLELRGLPADPELERK